MKPRNAKTTAHGLARRDFLRGLVLASCGFATPGALLAARPRNLADDAMSFLGRELPVLRRNQWCTLAPRLQRLRTARAYTRLTVHHSGNAGAVSTARGEIRRQIEGVMAGHMDRSYGDIGYHLIVDYAGGVWEGRPLTFEGAHVYAENDANVGVMLLGNFEEQAPSAAQLTAMRKTVYLLCRHFSIPAARVYGHRDLGASVCPGRRLYAHVDVMRVTRHGDGLRPVAG